jgi:hypothetical protein
VNSESNSSFVRALVKVMFERLFVTFSRFPLINWPALFCRINENDKSIALFEKIILLIVEQHSTKL